MSKHSGINATRDVLKDQLALAASEIERLRAVESDVRRHYSPAFFAAPISWWGAAFVGAIAMLVGINLGLALA